MFELCYVNNLFQLLYLIFLCRDTFLQGRSGQVPNASNLAAAASSFWNRMRVPLFIYRIGSDRIRLPCLLLLRGRNGDPVLLLLLLLLLLLFPPNQLCLERLPANDVIVIVIVVASKDDGRDHQRRGRTGPSKWRRRVVDAWSHAMRLEP